MSRRVKVRKGARGPDGQFKKRDGARQEQKPVQLITTLGTSILSPNTTVYSSLGDGTYVEKPASEVRLGESVVFSKEVLRGGGTTITLDDVDGVLRESRRYTNAAGELYAECEDGSHTTRFRAELLEGAVNTDSRDEWPEELTGDVRLRVRIRGGREHELTDDQAEAAATFVRETLEAREQEVGNPVVSQGHIRRGWLGGITVAPRQFEKVFEALERIAPRLRQLRESEAFKTSYRAYVVIRQNVMRAINDVLEPGRSDRSSTASAPAEDATSTRPEIRLVVDHFITDVSKRYAVARVLNVKEITGREARDREESVLSRGVATRVDDPDIEVSTMRRVQLSQQVLVQLVLRLVHDFLKENYPNGAFGIPRYSLTDSVNVYLGEELGYEGFYDSFLQAIEKMKEQGICPEGFGAVDKTYHKYMKKMANEFLRELENGSLDRKHGLPEGYLYNLFNRHYQFLTALPKISLYRGHLSQATAHLDRLNRERLKRREAVISRKPLESEMDRVDKILRTKYNLKLSAAYLLSKVNIHIGHVGLSDAFADKLFESGENPLRLLREAARGDAADAILEDVRMGLCYIVTPEEALTILRDLGFPEAVPLYPVYPDE